MERRDFLKFGTLFVASLNAKNVFGNVVSEDNTKRYKLHSISCNIDFGYEPFQKFEVCIEDYKERLIYDELPAYTGITEEQVEELTHSIKQLMTENDDCGDIVIFSAYTDSDDKELTSIFGMSDFTYKMYAPKLKLKKEKEGWFKFAKFPHDGIIFGRK